MKRTAIGLLIGLAITAIGIFAADPSFGTWKWNAAKSTTDAVNALKNRTDVYEATPDGSVRLTRTELRADGSAYHSSYTFKYDGKEYSVTGLQFDTFSAKWIDAVTAVFETKKTGGPYHQVIKVVYSDEGRTMTTHTTGFRTDGQPVTSTYVYDKQ